MKIMVVGGGGREHAIIKKLKESPDAGQIYALPGNGGIAADAVCVPIAATELGQIVEFAVREAIDFRRRRAGRPARYGAGRPAQRKRGSPASDRRRRPPPSKAANPSPRV